MSRQYSSQFRERVVALVEDGQNVRDLSSELEIAAATIYRWKRQARIDVGEIVGVNSEMASELADAKRPIRDSEEELVATKLAASLWCTDIIEHPTRWIQSGRRNTSIM